MQDSILYIVLTLLCVVIYLLLTQRKGSSENENKEKDEIIKLKDSLTNSINTMSTSFNTLSKDVTRDMTHALTKVDFTSHGKVYCILFNLLFLLVSYLCLMCCRITVSTLLLA